MGIGTPTPADRNAETLSGGVLPEGEIVVESQEVQEDREALASEYILGNVQLENELYCDYRCRRWWENQLLKRYLKGRTIWKASDRGEVRNPKRNSRDSKLRRKKDAQLERVQDIRQAQGILTPEQVKSWNRKAKKKFIRNSER
jgi:hypothetical protein